MLKSIWQKILSVLVALSAAVMVAGCANGINEDSGSKVALLMQLSASSSKSTAKYASVTVDTGSESSRNVDVSTIKFAISLLVFIPVTITVSVVFVSKDFASLPIS